MCSLLNILRRYTCFGRVYIRPCFQKWFVTDQARHASGLNQHGSVKYTFARFARWIFSCFEKVYFWVTRHARGGGVELGKHSFGKIGVGSTMQPARDYSEHPMTTFCRKHRALGLRTDRTGRFFVTFFSFRVFRKFFGKAANILPQIKHERPQRSYVAECIVSEKEGDHVVAGGGELCSSGGRLLENQARARGFWRKSKLAGQKMRQVLGGDHMCYPCLSLGALHVPVKQPVWSEHSMGCTPYTAHTHTQSTISHTQQTRKHKMFKKQIRQDLQCVTLGLVQ